MNDDLIDLASALLDDELSVDDRARLAADPVLNAQVVAEAERMGLVRDSLADVEQPAISLREEHLSAALDAWDRLPASEFSGSTGDDTDAVVALADQRRRRRSRASWRPMVLGVAAAVAVIAAAGIVLQNLDVSPNDEPAAANAPEAPAEESLSELDDISRQASEFATEEAPAATEAPASEEPASEAPAEEEAAEEEAPAEESAVEAEEPVAEADTAASDSADDAGSAGPAGTIEASPVADGESPEEEPPPAELDESPINSEDELIDLALEAQLARDAAAASTLPPNEVDEELPLCSVELGVDFFVGPIVYLGEDAFAGIDDDTQRVIAYREDCTAIVQLRLPS